MLRSVALILLTTSTLVCLIKEEDINVPKFLQLAITSLNFLILGFDFYKYFFWQRLVFLPI